MNGRFEPALSKRFMALALSEAALALREGCHPYPGVGAVLIHNGQPVARAHNGVPGQPHAEVRAIAAANVPLIDCVLYTNLEPCSNSGLVHACTKDIVDVGIKEVHIALIDPYYLVRGQGIEQLEAADVHCVVGELAEETRWLLKDYIARFCSHCGWPTIDV